MHKGRDSPWAILAVIAALGGISAAEGRAQTYQVRDSAGVALVLTGPGQDDDEGPWRLSGQPVLTIGQIEGEGPYLFTDVWDALRTPDGRFVVVDAGTYDIRVFTAEGKHEVSFGRSGGGPLEFGGPPWISVAAPDTLVVWDPGHFRLSRYNLEGELLEQATVLSRLDSLGIVPFPNGLVWQTAPDGGLLWSGRNYVMIMREGHHTWTSRFLYIPEDEASAHDYGSWVTDQVYYMRRNEGGLSGIANPLSPYTTAALALEPNRVAISDPERWEVRISDAGGVLRKIWRGDFPRIPVMRPMITRMREQSTAAAAGLRLTRRQAEEAFDQLPIPDSVPAIGVLIWDRSGNLWVGRRTGTIWDIGTYDVLTENGRWVASLELPDGAGRILDIGDSYVLATGRDQFGVQYVHLYQLEKGAPPRNEVDLPGER